jgi:hypothetical protein
VNKGFLFDLAFARNPEQRNHPERFTLADAPPAASNRALRRTWVAEANAALRRTGDPDAARRAAAEALVAALDLDHRIARARLGEDRRGLPTPAITLPRDANRRGRNCDGAGDRVSRNHPGGGPAMTALSGGLGDLVARAEGRPIYCTASPGVRRALVAVVVDSFHREFPHAVFVNALAHYRHADDRRRRWPRERDDYGAAIVVTRAENRPEGADPFAGLVGEHVINVWTTLEIEYLAGLGRPVAWHAVVFPAAYWLSRFAIEPFPVMRTSRWAQLLPSTEAEAFHPTIGPSPLIVRTLDDPGSG